MANSHLEGSSRALTADDPRRSEHDADSKNDECVHEPNRNSVQRCDVGVEEDHSSDALTINDVSPIEAARERLLDIVASNFIRRCTVDLMDYWVDHYIAQYEQENLRKRKSSGVRFEGDSQFVYPLKYVENIYETLVNEVNARLASLDGFLDQTIGVDLESAGGVYRRLARKFPEQGPYTFERREVTPLFEAIKCFPELVFQEEKGVHFVVVNGLDIVEKPDSLSDADAEWFKRLTGRSEVSISAQDYKFYSPRHNHQLAVSNPSLNIPGLPSHAGTNGSPMASPLVLCSIAEEKQSTSCSAKSMESKAHVKPPNIPQRHSEPYVEEPYICEVPKFMVPFIIDFYDNFAFGHSGFQAIAGEVRLSDEGGWCGVRRDLFMELACNLDLYSPVVFTGETVKRIMLSLAVWTIPSTLPEQQFSIPDMGHLVATHYQVVSVALGRQQCVTFLPLHIDSHSDDPLSISEICTVYLHHLKRYISVTLCEGFRAPLPPIHPLWHRHHDISADGLDLR